MIAGYEEKSQQVMKEGERRAGERHLLPKECVLRNPFLMTEAKELSLYVVFRQSFSKMLKCFLSLPDLQSLNEERTTVLLGLISFCIPVFCIKQTELCEKRDNAGSYQACLFSAPGERMTFLVFYFIIRKVQRQYQL